VRLQFANRGDGPLKKNAPLLESGSSHHPGSSDVPMSNTSCRPRWSNVSFINSFISTGDASATRFALTIVFRRRSVDRSDRLREVKVLGLRPGSEARSDIGENRRRILNEIGVVAQCTRAP